MKSDEPKNVSSAAEQQAQPASESTTTFLKKTGTKGVLCPKCNHLNREHSAKCSRCGSHLHIKCKDCGARNERIYSRCQTCGRRLHKSVLEKMTRGVFAQKARITPMQVVLLLIFALVAFYCVLSLERINTVEVSQ